MIIVIAETQQNRLNPASLEALGAALSLNLPVTAVVPGRDTSQVAGALSHYPLAGVVRLEHPALSEYTPDATVAALAGFIDAEAPSHVFAAHTYQARDFVPRLATRFDRPLLTDCIGIEVSGADVTWSRPIFQGKVVADVTLEGPAPHFVCVQIGAFRDAVPEASETPAAIRSVAANIPDAARRQTVEAPFRESAQEVDLGTAARIVAAGRGIKEEGQLEVVRKLAAAMGAEIAASRPLCDAGWLPMDRQIGSSGQTVAPQLYVGLGISGAIQHIVGIKGARTVVAVNKDADAPIFEIADFGIVGDLFEIVPALVAALEAT